MKELEILGFTKYEAMAYAALLEHGELNGYALSKVSRIPKPNAYAVLNTMVDKGYAFKIEGKSVYYRPKPFEDIEKHYRQELETNFALLKEQLPKCNQKSSPFYSLDSENKIINKARELISESQSHILMELSEVDLKLFLPILLEKEKNGTTVLVHIETSQKQLNLGLRHVFIHPELLTQDLRDFHMVIDKQVALSGQLGSHHVKGVFTSNDSLISLVTDAISHDVLLGEVIKHCDKEILASLEELENLFYSK